MHNFENFKGFAKAELEFPNRLRYLLGLMGPAKAM